MTPELGRQAKHLTTTAKVPHRWAFVHDEAGYNYRMPNLNAALGCAQLEQLPGFLDAKRRLFTAYREAFSALPACGCLRSRRVAGAITGCRRWCWRSRRPDEREAILAATNDAGLMTRPVWTLMHRLKPYQTCPRMALPVAESLERRLINIPSSAGIVCPSLVE